MIDGGLRPPEKLIDFLFRGIYPQLNPIKYLKELLIYSLFILLRFHPFSKTYQ
jgi:hypothetical protein